MDPVLKHHLDPDAHLATFLLSRGASRAVRNLAGQLPGEGLGEPGSAVEQSERSFDGAAQHVRSPGAVVEAVERHRQEHAEALTALARGRPLPKPTVLQKPPLSVQQYEESLSDSGGSLLAVRRAARAGLRAAGS